LASGGESRVELAGGAAGPNHVSANATPTKASPIRVLAALTCAGTVCPARSDYFP